MSKYYFILVIFVLFYNCIAQKLATDYINPMIGAVTYGEKTTDIHGFGKTFPGAATPFGLVQLSPDTRTGGDNGSGYSWNHSTIEGFSFTHMSGVGWFGDLGNFLVMPTTGKLYTHKGAEDHPENGYRSRFSHDKESAKVGYYRVRLADYNIQAELSAAPRAGILRFTFPQHDSSRIQIDLARRVGGTSTEQFVKIENDSTISGWMKCPPEGGGWGNGAGKADYVVYFNCQFSKPFTEYGIWHADIPDEWSRKLEDVTAAAYQNHVAQAVVHKNVKSFQGEHIGFFANYQTTANEKILVKAGISFVSIDGAKRNLQNDIPNWDFERVVTQADSLWQDAFKSVTVSGATDREKEIFYTALYHTMIDPRAFSDVDGKYIGADKNEYETANFTYRTIFSGWDVFRSQFPLQTLINPALVNDEINSLIHMAASSGREYFPRWEFLNSYSGCMLGNPAVSVVVDAFEKGIRNYNIEQAFQYCKNSVNKFGNGELGYRPNSISETLEYAYTDWCVGRFAESLNKMEDAKKYDAKSMNYKNLWNEDVSWFRSRAENGDWMPWQGRTTHGQGCVESNPYQQGWFVPHDIAGLTELIGGRTAIQKELVDFFEQAPADFLWNDYYNHPNEPVHHIPFLFNEIGLPRQTQKWTRRICDAAYGTDAFGLCGNEDVGQMSAWYVLAAIGLHPVCPGDNRYQITSPVFNKIELQLDSNYYGGNTFTILAHNNSPENIFIRSMKLNGKPLYRYWLTHDEIVSGGVLELEMGK